MKENFASYTLPKSFIKRNPKSIPIDFNIGEIVKVKGDSIYMASYSVDLETDDIKHGSPEIDPDKYYIGEITKKEIYAVDTGEDYYNTSISFVVTIPYYEDGYHVKLYAYDIEPTRKIEKIIYIAKNIPEKDKFVVYNTTTNLFVKESIDGELVIKQFDSFKEAIRYTETFTGNKMVLQDPYLIVYRDMYDSIVNKEKYGDI